jgi:DNA-binding winged helix-turn-helix (wHTH) protein
MKKLNRLLALLVEHAGEVVSRVTLLTQVWGYAPEKLTRTLGAHVS